MFLCNRFCKLINQIISVKFRKFIVDIVFRVVGATHHKNTFFRARICTEVAIATFRHINGKATHHQGFPGIVRCGSRMFNFRNIFPAIWRFNRIYFDTVHRTSTLAFEATYAIIDIHMKPGTNHIVIRLLKTDISLRPGPPLFWVLECHIIPFNIYHMAPGNSHTCPKGIYCFINVCEILCHNLSEN